MRLSILSALALALPLVLSACGGNDNSNNASTQGAGAGGSGTGGSGTGATTGSGGGHTVPGEFDTLVEADWSLAAGTENYYCAVKTIEQDMFVNAFRALSPDGTHHTVVTLYDGPEADGGFPCGPGTISDAMIYSSGVGTDDMAFPEGVAIRIAAGQKVLLNLHLFNPSGEVLTGKSGTLVQTIDESEVVHQAEMVFAGSIAIAVPPQSENTTSGWCAFPQDSTIMTVWPHMHQYGTHMEVVHEAAGGDVTLHDAPFNFNEQLNYPIDEVLVKAGETIRVRCSYMNTSDATVTFGDSSNQEMCFAGLYRYPALFDGTFCDLPF